MSALAPRPDAVCRCCTGPLIRVRDDPHDPHGTTHPGCDPVDPPAWEQFLRRDKKADDPDLLTADAGVMRAILPSRCRGCGQPITVGSVQALRPIDGHMYWVCRSCAVGAA